MKVSAENIKKLLIDSGLNNSGTAGNDLEELAREISESIDGIGDRRSLTDTIYGNLVASGIDFEAVDNLMGTAEKVAHSIFISSSIQ